MSYTKTLSLCILTSLCVDPILLTQMSKTIEFDWLKMETIFAVTLINILMKDCIIPVVVAQW